MFCCPDKKPVILLNVRGFYSCLHDFVEGYVSLSLSSHSPSETDSRPLRAITAGFISPSNRAFMVFVDEPSSAGVGFDWGEAALAAIEDWEKKGAGGGKPYSLEWPENKKGELR
jgi:hypothetical protein